MKVLIVDDSRDKMKNLKEVIATRYPLAKISLARSFQGALSHFDFETPDLIILDMTLPTSETDDGRPEGRIRIYGGRELLGEIDFLGLDTKVIIVTQFEEFQEGDRKVHFESLLHELTREFPNFVIGGVFYSSIGNSWEENVLGLITSVFES